MQWTQADLKSVTIITLFNGLWLGVLSWLVLGLWLEWLSFLTCWDWRDGDLVAGCDHACRPGDWNAR